MLFDRGPAWTGLADAAILVRGDAHQARAHLMLLHYTFEIAEAFGYVIEERQRCRAFLELLYSHALDAALVAIVYDAEARLVDFLRAIELWPEPLDLVRLQEKRHEFIATELVGDGMYRAHEVLFLPRGRVIREVAADALADLFCLADLDDFTLLIVEVINARQIRQLLEVLPRNIRR